MLLNSFQLFLIENVVEIAVSLASGSIFFGDKDSFVILLAICHFVIARCHRGIVLIRGLFNL